MLRRVLITWWLLTGYAIAAEPPVRVFKVTPGKVQTLTTGEGISATADVSWEVIEPASLSFLTSKDGRTFAVFVEQRVVVLRDVIDWDLRKRSKVKTILDPGTGPDPKPDDDDPLPPDPPTPPPTPDNVIDTFGIGRVAYAEAARIGSKPQAKQMAASLKALAWEMHEGRTLPADATARLETFARGLGPGWDAWTKTFGANVLSASITHGDGLVAVKSFWREAADALEVYAR